MTNTSKLPQGWARLILGDVIEIIRGVTYDKSEVMKQPTEGLVPILRATNINGKLDFDGLVYVPKRFVSENQMLQRGDIVLAASSGSLSVVGKAARLISSWHGSFGAFCMGLRVSDEIDSRYVSLFLQTSEYRNRVSELAAGSNINNLKREHILSFPFRMAPLLEQRRIISKVEELFSDLDAGVSALERVKANLNRYRASVLKAAVEGKLTAKWRKEHPNVEPATKLLARILNERRQKWEADQLAKFKAAGRTPPKGWQAKYDEPTAPDIGNLPHLPKGWCWATAEQLGCVQLGRQRSPKNQSKNYPTKYIRAANLTETGLDLDDVLDMEFQPNELETYRLMPGDVLLSEASGSPNQVGKPAVWAGQLVDCCFQNTVIRLRPFGVRSDYLLVIFRQFYSGKVFAKMAAGVGINHLSAGKFSELPIPVAPLEEQAAISAEVGRGQSIIAAVESMIQASSVRAVRLRQSILKRAFEGELVPQDPSDEPATKLLERLHNSHPSSAIAAKSGIESRHFSKRAGKEPVGNANT